jgi:heat shock protein HslJ
VVLEDISLADAPAVEMGRATAADPGQPPFSFSIAYDPDAVDAAHTYAVRARITVDGRLFFTTDRVAPVLTLGHDDQVELLLVRSARGADEATGTGPMRGMFRYLADAALFTDCATARRLPVAMEGDYLALERAYLEGRSEPGTEVLVTFRGRVEERPAMEGDRRVDTVIVEELEGVWPGETCGNPGATEALEDTYWKLTRLRGAPVRVLEDRREPHLVLRSQETRVTGFGGCNGFGGSYELDGERLSLGPLMGTMMACPGAMDQEHAFMTALEAVRSWRIEGQHLELLDEEGERLLRLEARAFP